MSAQLPTVAHVLNECGLDALATNPSADAVATVLERLGSGLHGLSRPQVSVVRKEVARRLKKLRVDDADELVQDALGEMESGISFGRVEVHENPVGGDSIIEMLVPIIERFVVLTRAQAIVIALWIMFTYVIDAFQIAPILGIRSPTKRCGKTTAMLVIHALACRPLFTNNITAAALFRVISRHHPTLVIDEADTFLTGNEELRGILNAGHTRKAAYVIKVATGPDGDLQAHRYDVWAPKVIAKIGALQSTLEDRSIVIVLQRRTANEGTERLRQDRLDAEVSPLPAMLTRWAADAMDQLRQADPALPDELSDRAQDNWRPLFSIAETCGGDWPERLRGVALEVQGLAASDAETPVDEILLGQLRELFATAEIDKCPSEVLVAMLAGHDPRWAGLTPIRLAELLRPYGIRPRVIRVGLETPRGYARTELQAVFDRYLDGRGNQSATDAT